MVTTRISHRNPYTSFTCTFTALNPPPPSKSTVENKGPRTAECKSEIPAGRRTARAIIKRTRWDRLVPVCDCVSVCEQRALRLSTSQPARIYIRYVLYMIYTYYVHGLYILWVYTRRGRGPGWRQCDDDSTATVCYDTWTRWPGGGICRAGDLHRQRTRLWLHLYGQVSTTMYIYTHTHTNIIFNIIY